MEIFEKKNNNDLVEVHRQHKLPKVAICFTMDVVCLYPNMSHGFASLYKVFETRENKQISSDTLAELVEIGQKQLKQI